MRGVIGGVLTLIALQVFSSGSGPAAGGKLVGWVNTGLKKALSPEVALIPTRKTAPPSSSKKPAPAGGISLPRNPSVGSVQV